MGPYGGIEQAGLFEAVYALAFALPLALLAWARAHLFDSVAQGVPQPVSDAGMAVTGFAVVLLLVTARSHLPDGGWGALPSPPAPLESLVRTSPVTVLDGVVYEATADGKVLGLFCAAGNGCGWEVVCDLPPPDPASFWQGVCDPQGGHALLWLEPRRRNARWTSSTR